MFTGLNLQRFVASPAPVPGCTLKPGAHLRLYRSLTLVWFVRFPRFVHSNSCSSNEFHIATGPPDSQVIVLNLYFYYMGCIRVSRKPGVISERVGLEQKKLLRFYMCFIVMGPSSISRAYVQKVLVS